MKKKKKKSYLKFMRKLMNIKPYRDNKVIKSQEQIEAERSAIFKNETLNSDADSMLTQLVQTVKPCIDDTGAWYVIVVYTNDTKTYIYDEYEDASYDYKLLMKTVLQRFNR